MPDERNLTEKGADILTVSELTRDIRFVLEDSFSDVWVEGELSNFKIYPSGHAYFSIKDDSSVLNCVMFKSSAAKIRFDPENGLHVLCGGRISVYDKRGQYQLYVERMEPRGQGALQLAFERLKKQLFEEGLFDEERKKPLPSLPLRIGIVTSPAGAAIRDILKVTRRRYPNMHVSLRPVKVQGDDAKHEIARAIEELNEYNRYLAGTGSEEHPIDVLIVGRGGGSLEDLWAFNEEIVARAIAASEIPVISAVGHEVDYTISDFVSDLRAPTPSAAAEICVPLKEELEGGIEQCRDRAGLAVRRKIGMAEEQLVALRESYVLREPENVFIQLGQQVDDLVKTATSGIKHLLEIRGMDLAAAAGKLGALSPLAVLERGYSITFRGDQVIKDASVLKTGEILRTKLSSGSVSSKVESVEADKEEA